MLGFFLKFIYGRKLGVNMKTKDKIIDLLGKEWPLTAKKIHFQLKKHYRVGITYHSVYELIQNLLSEKSLIKIKSQYLLNTQWLKEKRDYFEALEKAYEFNKPIKFIDKNTSQVKVTSINELYQFLAHNFDNDFFAYAESSNMCIYFNHVWGSFFTPEKAAKLNKCFKKKAYLLCKNDSTLDRRIAGYYKKKGIKTRLGIELFPQDTIIQGDTTIQIHFSDEIEAELDQIFDKKISISTIRQAKNILEKPTTINVVITRNKTIATKLRNQIMKQFE